MSKERSGYIMTEKDGSLWARITYTDASGKRRNIKRRAVNRTEAKRLIKELLAELDQRGERGLDGQRMTFKHLAAKYEAHKIFAAEYHGTRKVAGLRSWKASKGFLNALLDNFGAKLIRDITHADLEKFKRKRLKETIRRKVKNKAGDWQIIVTDKPRTIASVNRELEVMRAVMNFAKRQKWIASSPFEEGDPLISKADETKRERILSFDEERRLMAACADERAITYERKGKIVTAHIKGGRQHILALIIAALDTGMRRGELFKLCWQDTDLAGQTIHITEMNSKTARARTIAMTPRLHAELTRLWEQSPKDISGLVFGIVDTIKRAWASACEDAGIEGLRFHDLRHTALTRMIQAGVPPMEVMKMSGHTQMVTFARYINPATDSLQRAAAALAAFNSQQIDAVDNYYESVN